MLQPHYLRLSVIRIFRKTLLTKLYLSQIRPGVSLHLRLFRALWPGVLFTLNFGQVEKAKLRKILVNQNSWSRSFYKLEFKRPVVAPISDPLRSCYEILVRLRLLAALWRLAYTSIIHIPWQNRRIIQCCIIQFSAVQASNRDSAHFTAWLLAPFESNYLIAHIMKRALCITGISVNHSVWFRLTT